MHARNEKDDLLPVSKDCSQQGTKKKHFLYHCSSPGILTEEASLRTTTQQWQNNNKTGSGLSARFLFYTLTVFIRFRVAHHSGRDQFCFTLMEKRKLLHVVQKKNDKELCLFILDKLAGCFHRPPIPLPSTRLKRSLFLFLNHQTGPTLSWTFKCNIFRIFFFFNFIVINFVHYYWCCLFFCFLSWGKDWWLRSILTFILFRWWKHLIKQETTTQT